MTPSAAPDLYKHHRFPGEIISHAVWRYFRFPLSHRDVEELLLVRGIMVSYEAIRKWCRKFGQPYANQLRHRRPRPGDKWHLDVVFITINKERHYLWTSGRIQTERYGFTLHEPDFDCLNGFSGRFMAQKSP
jgi:putative transposase